MKQDVSKQNSFFQSRMNSAKLGAYYTDTKHCKWIAELLEFPKNKEVCCLEPSIGNASAVIDVTNRKENSKIHIFGVEINKDVATKVMENQLVEECICADFLTGSIISKNAFSLCVANPPYGESHGERLEWQFLRRIIECLKNQAVLVFIIPYYVACEDAFLKFWSANFTTEYYFRFHDEEFAKWKQVVLIGRKEKERDVDVKQFLKMQKNLSSPENMLLLPTRFEGNRVKVNPSLNKDVNVFKNKEFDFERAKKALEGGVFEKLVKEKITQSEFILDQLEQPPIMPNAGQMYLMAIAGAGQGIVGSSESQDKHLQRGMVTNAEESDIRIDTKGNKVEAIQKFTRINFNIIENDGTMHTL